jgi:hypothetical protein
MAAPGISSAGSHAAKQQAMQSVIPHQHRANHFHTNTDIDSVGSSVATAASSTGKVGGKIDIKA